jgi:hypothetical protein
MTNLFCGEDQRDFYVWVDPSNWLIRHQIQETGSFFSVHPEDREEALMFIPNPKFRGGVSPFQNNLLQQYIAEYQLEVARQTCCPKYPCRLQAIFLFESEEEADKYRERHFSHVGNRVLKRVKTVGYYCYSLHDSSWIDFLRLSGWNDLQTLDNVCKAYWGGHLVKSSHLQSLGKVWTEEPIIEVLYLGTVEFYERSLDLPMHSPKTGRNEPAERTYTYQES